MPSPKPQKAVIDRSLIVPVLADAAVAGRGVAEGRLIPVVLLDTSSRPEVAELIRAQRHLPPGDVAAQWGGKIEGDEDTILLSLHFVRPMDVAVVLVFSIEERAMLVDAIVTSGAVYIQAATPGDRLITTMDADRMLVEVADGDFQPIWDKLLRERMLTVMAKRLGVRRRKARPAAEQLIAEIRRVTRFRMPS